MQDGRLDDDLAPAKGIALALVLSACLWAPILAFLS